MTSARTYEQQALDRKRSLFDEKGKIQLNSFDPTSIDLDTRIKDVNENIANLEQAQVVTQETLQLEFSV